MPGARKERRSQENTLKIIFKKKILLKTDPLGPGPSVSFINPQT